MYFSVKYHVLPSKHLFLEFSFKSFTPIILPTLQLHVFRLDPFVPQDWTISSPLHCFSVFNSKKHFHNLQITSTNTFHIKLWTSTTSNVYLIRPRQIFWLSLVEEVMINPRDLRIKSGKSWRSHWSIKSIMYNRRLITLFRNKLLFLQVCYTSLLKTLREKEKLLVTSNFSFSHSVFKSFGDLGADRMVLDLYKIDKWPKFSIDRR